MIKIMSLVYRAYVNSFSKIVYISGIDFHVNSIILLQIYHDCIESTIHGRGVCLTLLHGKFEKRYCWNRQARLQVFRCLSCRQAPLFCSNHGQYLKGERSIIRALLICKSQNICSFGNCYVSVFKIRFESSMNLKINSFQ